MKEDAIYWVGTEASTGAVVERVSAFFQVGSIAFSSAEDFLNSTYQEFRGCLLAEIQLRGMSGIALQEKLRESSSLLPVILMTNTPCTHLIVRAMQNGAVTVFEEPCSEGELSAAIEFAFALYRERFRQSTELNELRSRLHWLTDAEREVLDLILSGAPNKVIAKQLDVSVRTVEARRKRILEKTQSNSLPELMQLVMRVQYDVHDPMIHMDRIRFTR